MKTRLIVCAALALAAVFGGYAIYTYQPKTDKKVEIKKLQIEIEKLKQKNAELAKEKEQPKDEPKTKTEKKDKDNGKAKAEEELDETGKVLKGIWNVTYNAGELPDEMNLKGALKVNKVSKEKDGYKLSGTYENKWTEGESLTGTFEGKYSNNGKLVLDLQQMKPVKIAWTAEVTFPLTKDGKIIEDGEGEWQTKKLKAVKWFKLSKKHGEPKKEMHVELTKYLKVQKDWKGTAVFTLSLFGTASYKTEAKITGIDEKKNEVKLEVEVKDGGLTKKQTATGAFTGTRFSGKISASESIQLTFYKEGTGWKASGWLEQNLGIAKYKRLMKLEAK